MNKVVGYDYRYKIIIIGARGAGKSSLVNRMLGNDIKEVDTTIGVEFTSTMQTIENKMIKIHMWDCAGDEAFFPLIQVYFRDAACALVVMDLSCDEGLKLTRKWIERYKNEKGDTEIPFILIGNKIDLVEERKIKEEEGKKLAEDYGGIYIEVSAKTGANTRSCLSKITTHIYDNMEKGLCGIRYGHKLEIDKGNKDYYNCCIIS